MPIYDKAEIVMNKIAENIVKPSLPQKMLSFNEFTRILPRIAGKL
jgi:hypothetical protein